MVYLEVTVEFLCTCPQVSLKNEAVLESRNESNRDYRAVTYIHTCIHINMYLI